MTDFIHEHPKEESAQEQKEDIYSAPADSKTRAKRVMVYALSLFVVAFLLLLWSFLMNDNNNRKVLSSISDLQTSVKDDSALTSRVLKLEEDLEFFERQNEELTLLNKQNSSTISAMDRLREMQAAFAVGDSALAKKAAFEMVDCDLISYLPETSQHTFDGADAESPRAAYDRMCAQLFPDGMDREFAVWQKNH